MIEYERNKELGLFYCLLNVILYNNFSITKNMKGGIYDYHNIV